MELSADEVKRILASRMSEGNRPKAFKKIGASQEQVDDLGQVWRALCTMHESRMEALEYLESAGLGDSADAIVSHVETSFAKYFRRK